MLFLRTSYRVWQLSGGGAAKLIATFQAGLARRLPPQPVEHANGNAAGIQPALPDAAERAIAIATLLAAVPAAPLSTAPQWIDTTARRLVPKSIY